MDGFVLGEDEYDDSKIGYYPSFQGEPPQPMHYGMDGKPCSPGQMARLRESGERIIAQQTIGKHWVSTVHLGMDHGMMSHLGNAPIIFETMVFPVFEEQRPCDDCKGSGKFDWSFDGMVKGNVQSDGSHIRDCMACKGTGLREDGDIDMGEEYCERYATVQQAREGHGRIVDALIETGELPEY